MTRIRKKPLILKKSGVETKVVAAPIDKNLWNIMEKRKKNLGISYRFILQEALKKYFKGEVRK